MARGHGEVGAEWRARWRASTKTASPPFEGVTTDWNINQVALTYWSSFYDSIFEHPDRPDQKVINNDYLLDSWVEKMSKEMEENARKNSRGYGKQSLGAHDHEEVIIFDEEEWEEVLEEERYEEEDF